MEPEGANGATAVVPRRRKPSQAESVASQGTPGEAYMPGSMEFEMTLEYMRHSWASGGPQEADHAPYQEGGMDDHDETTRGPSVMARIDAYRRVFAHASLIAGGMAPNELPPLECPK